ncbi:MAG: GC-type dockerin domain-anchored protein [Phycisphaerales bacterium]|jgi:hypothetical protein|nr:GC-type dockerin domain-anchored protein [Phycisphaerales bacterium]
MARRSMAAAVSRRLACAALVGVSGTAWADDVVVVDLTGVRLQNGLNQSVTSGADTIDPDTLYSYVIDGMVRGESGLLAALVPNPRPLGEVLELFAAGASSALVGTGCNPSGQVPFDVVNAPLSGSSVVLGITVNASVTLSAGIDANGVAYFSATNVVLTPSSLVGSAVFTSGSVTVRGLRPCLADWDASGGTPNSSDFLSYLNDWSLGDACADLAPPGGDGNFDSSDFLAFLNAYAGGC